MHMALIRWTPTLSTFDAMDRMFDDLFPTALAGVRNQSFVPPVDVYQDKEDVVVEIPLPGVNPKDVRVTVENDVLTIEGKSERKSEIEEENYYRKEVRYGTFHRAIGLPVAVDGDKAKATFASGILKVTIPKAAHARAKEVAVEVRE